MPLALTEELAELAFTIFRGQWPATKFGNNGNHES